MMPNFVDVTFFWIPRSFNLKNGTDDSSEQRCQNNEKCKCCSGLCIDLLTKFEDELGFTYDLVRTDDPKWGTFEVCKK